jgi:hypothetical protein
VNPRADEGAELKTAAHLLIPTTWILAVVVLVGCSTDSAPLDVSLGVSRSPLEGIALAREGVAKHEGSWDRSGGNADFRPVDPGQTITLLDYNGAGIVRRFWCTIAPRADRDIHRQAILRMYWDGETTPAVECPIGDFFGVGFGEQKDYISLPLNETSGGYNCYWPMPFHKSAKWTLTNLSPRKIDAFYYNIDFIGYDKLPDEQLRHFHAVWNRENPTSRDKNYTILDVEGAGHYVGVALFMQGLRPRGLGFLEGDEMITFDGAAKPQVVGTGTEDYFSSGWYYDRGTYSAPYHGVVVKDEQNSRISTYRWNIEEAMPFAKSAHVTIEHGTNNEVEADYSSVAYCYLAPGAKVNRKPLPDDRTAYLPSEPPRPKRIAGAIEGEDLVAGAKATEGPVEVQWLDAFAGEYSGGAQLWWRPSKAGETLTFNLPVEKAGSYDVIGRFVKAPDYATISVKIGDGEEKTIDLYAPSVMPSGPISLGVANLKQGGNTVTIKTTGKAAQSTNYLVGVDAVELKPVK